MSERIERNGVYERNVYLVATHNFFVGGYVYDFSDNAESVLVVLIFNEFAFERNRQIVDF